MSNPAAGVTGNGTAPGSAVIRLLIADDHPMIHSGLATLIHAEKPAWEICVAAADGREAIARATELRPDLVIMDCRMPHVNGLEATAEIYRVLPAIAVLIFTGSECRHTLAKAFQSKARGCLLKSEGPDALIHALESILHRHRFRSHGITAVCDDILETSGKLDKLTEREKETTRLIAECKSTKQVAAHLGVSIKTTETHRANIFAKLQVRSVAELVLYAVRTGLVRL